MPPPSGFTTSETLPPAVRVHVLGAGPVGLLVAALLQSTDRFSVHLYEKRRDYSRTRMVQLAPYLVADSIASYCTDYIDGESVEAIFEPSELEEGLAFRQSIPPDLMGLLQGWTLGFCPLNDIERSLSDLIDARQSHPVQRTSAVVTAQDAMAMLQPGDVLIDCTGTKSLLRDHAGARRRGGGWRGEYVQAPARVRARHHLPVWPGLRLQRVLQVLQEHRQRVLQFIPAVNRTYYDGSITHVTGIVNISAEDYERMPSRFDGQWLRSNFPQVAQSMDRFIAKVKTETNGRSSATWRSSGSRWICTGPAMRPAGSCGERGPTITRSPARRCS